MKKKIDISSIEKKDFLIPNASSYLAQQHEKIIQQTVHQREIKAELLRKIKREEVIASPTFETSDDYFLWLPAKIASRLPKKYGTNSVDLWLSKPVIQLAFAASLMIGLSLVFLVYIQKPNDISASMEQFTKQELIAYASDNELFVENIGSINFEGYELDKEMIEQELSHSELDEIIYLND